MSIDRSLPLRSVSGAIRSRWRAIDVSSLIAACLPILVILSLWPSAQSLWELWIQERRDSHAPVVLVMCILACAKSTTPRDWSDARPSLLGWTALGAFAVAWLVAVLLDVAIVHIGLIAVLMVCVLWSTTGPANARNFIVPTLLLLCALPVWDPVAEVLQSLSAKASGAILHVIGVPVVLNGFYVQIPSGTFVVESGCSGISFFQAGLALGLFLGVKEKLPTWATLVVACFFALIAIAANWIRIVTIVFAGHMTNMKHSLVVDGHYWFGWTLFAAAMLIALWFVMRRLPADSVAEDVPASQLVADKAAARNALRIAWPLILMAIASALARSEALQPYGAIVSAQWPLSIGSYQLANRFRHDGWSPRYPGAATQSRVSYLGEGGSYEAFAACYTRQSHGSELVGYDSSATGSALDSVSTISAQDPRFSLLRWRADDGSEWVATQGYRVGLVATGSPLLAKLANATLILGGRGPICTLIVASQCDGTCNDQLLDSQTLSEELVNEGLFGRP